MARLVTQWRTSGESGASFARRHQIPAWTFWYWCRKLAAAPVDTPAEMVAPTFVPVHMAADLDAPVLDVVFSGGERLQVRPGASLELVRGVVAALRSTC
jgi:hypothetical protein